MTRHGKNCTAGAVYTYHEKRKDTAASGYGTQSIRLGKDAIKDFDCCCLSLQPCKDPVVTAVPVTIRLVRPPACI
uniref:Nitric oxide synthase interacting protein n=1 Tax=Oryzias latipes TaxID=8090 RepID=A0A3P9L6Z0_ORYLA